jgi:hypothetical protein
MHHGALHVLKEQLADLPRCMHIGYIILEYVYNVMSKS